MVKLEASVLQELDVLVVGGGPAGIGVSVALKHAGVQNFLLVDRERLAASFERWPEGMRLITPSFPSNSIGMLDLNSVAIGTSPGYSLGSEHPTGPEFAQHLRGVARFFELPVREEVDVVDVTQDAEGRYHCLTAEGVFIAKHLVWATGEFGFPSIPRFPGAAYARHNSSVTKWTELPKGQRVIIGGYESGVDAAIQLARLGYRTTVLDRTPRWDTDESDPSCSLAPYTLTRLQPLRKQGLIELVGDVEVDRIAQNKSGYTVHSRDGRSWPSEQQPILATGFSGGYRRLSGFFELREDGLPLLNEFDESTIRKNLYLAGPSVRHDDLIFCFIYKFRQRFAIVASHIAQELGLDTSEMESTYRRWGMFLDDFSCCGEECEC